jgi:limonene-1,2-epoxide hydrolase
MSELIALSYVSTLTKAFAESDLSAAVEHFYNKNSTSDITGIMIVSGNKIMQTIEGDPDRIDSLFEIIKNDPRHDNVVLIYRADLAFRKHGSWMSIQRVSEHEFINSSKL